MFWEAWIRGFERAVRLRIECWESILRSDDEDAAAAVNLILAMSALVDGTSTLPEEVAEKVTREVPFLIPCCVLDLNAWTRERRGLGTARSGRSVHGPVDPAAAGPAGGRCAVWPQVAYRRTVSPTLWPPRNPGLPLARGDAWPPTAASRPGG